MASGGTESGHLVVNEPCKQMRKTPKQVIAMQPYQYQLAWINAGTSSKQAATYNNHKHACNAALTIMNSLMQAYSGEPALGSNHAVPQARLHTHPACHHPPPLNPHPIHKSQICHHHHHAAWIFIATANTQGRVDQIHPAQASACCTSGM